MKALLLTLAIPLLLGVVGSARGQGVPVTPLCAEHPAVTREVVMKARAAGHGIRAEFLSEQNARPQGREVAGLVDTGGGDCPVESTARGKAAAAVGALLYNGQIHCSAVLVNSTMIVTAAHCIQGFDPNKLEFVLGLDSEKPIQRASIYNADVNPRYDERHFGVNDIGYAYLNNQMTEATQVQLPESTLPRTSNVSLLHVGYGISGPKAGARRCVNIPVQDRCEDCFSYATKNMNTCNGDSGGAAFRDLGDQILFAGMTDWGDDACAEFGVDVDIGYYLDWIQARKSQAPRNLAYARVEPWARKAIKASPDQLAAQLGGGFPVEAKFDSLYKGGWVTWDARVIEVKPRNEDEILGTCGVIAIAGQATNLWLRQYPDGCGLATNSPIRFTGRLARIGPAGLDVVLAEPVTAQPLEAREAIGEYTLVVLTTDVQQVRERRSREVRLESSHGSWSGRSAVCVPVAIEAPWQLDRSAPIHFTPAHIDHAGYMGAVQNQTDQGFCVPLWAEGYGGTQLFGTTVDAGLVGVVSGSIEFGVVKTASTVTRLPLARGPITQAVSLSFPSPSPAKYEVHVKLRDGEEKTFADSGSLGAVSVDWADGGVALQAKPKGQMY
jgi:hypothetical protein